MDYNIRNKDITMGQAVDVRDTKMLSSESSATKAETNTTAEVTKQALSSKGKGGEASHT
jgi:hypothetical protein